MIYRLLVMLPLPISHKWFDGVMAFIGGSSILAITLTDANLLMTLLIGMATLGFVSYGILMRHVEMRMLLRKDRDDQDRHAEAAKRAARPPNPNPRKRKREDGGQ